MQLLLSPLQIQLVAKLSACSRDTERNRTWTRLVTQAAPAKDCLQQHSYKTQKQTAETPSSSPAGRDRSSLVKAHTQASLGSQAHTRSQILRVPGMTCLLSTPAWIPQVAWPLRPSSTPSGSLKYQCRLSVHSALLPRSLDLLLASWLTYSLASPVEVCCKCMHIHTQIPAQRGVTNPGGI